MSLSSQFDDLSDAGIDCFNGCIMLCLYSVIPLFILAMILISRPGEHKDDFWHGIDVSAAYDQALILPDLEGVITILATVKNKNDHRWRGQCKMAVNTAYERASFIAKRKNYDRVAKLIHYLSRKSFNQTAHALLLGHLSEMNDDHFQPIPYNRHDYIQHGKVPPGSHFHARNECNTWRKTQLPDELTFLEEK